MSTPAWFAVGLNLLGMCVHAAQAVWMFNVCPEFVFVNGLCFGYGGCTIVNVIISEKHPNEQTSLDL